MLRPPLSSLSLYPRHLSSWSLLAVRGVSSSAVPPRPRRLRARPSEEQTYEAELQALLRSEEIKAQNKRWMEAGEEGEEGEKDERAADTETTRQQQQQNRQPQRAAVGDDSTSNWLPEVVDFFDVDYEEEEWEADEESVRLNRASPTGFAETSTGAGGGAYPHHSQLQRVARVKAAVRDLLPAVLRSQSSLPGALVDLRCLPLLVTAIRVSSDVQWVAVQWTLVPHKADSSLCRLPASLSGHSLRSVLLLVSSQLQRCIGAVRSSLGAQLSLRYVPNVRFDYDGGRWRRRRRDLQRAREVATQRLSGDKQRDGGVHTRGGGEAEVAAFERFNPFTPQSAAGASNQTNNRNSASKRPSATIASTQQQQPRRESWRSKRERQHRRLLADIRRTGVVNGQQRFARPVQQQQQQQQQQRVQQRAAASDSSARRATKGEQWTRMQQRKLWESEL